MKNFVTLIILTLIIFSSTNSIAQKVKKQEKIIIKTSTECSMCKERVEKEMAYTKGITSAILDVEKSELTVTYKPHKTTLKKIREAISNLGYDADTIKASKKAYNNLPHCCQKGGMPH